MKPKTNHAHFISIIFILSCASIPKEITDATCHESAIQNQSYSRSDEVHKALVKLVESGVPGVAVSIYSNEGWWSDATGYARIEDQTPMKSCHLHYLQSISKTYMAVAVLKLFEQGKIDLDAPITRYLPDTISQYVTRAEEISVRMLLNHTSGIAEYNFAPKYVSYLLQHPNHRFNPMDYLGYIKGKPLDFEPGSRYSYRNTNYVLLALMTDAITGDHAKFITETIFNPLGLTQTYYRAEDGYLTYPQLINAYWDRYSDGIIENASEMQRTNVASMIGDDGIVTTPMEAVKFLKGLMEGKLVSLTTLDMMQQWVTDRQGKPRYGLGLSYIKIIGQEGMGHSGGGIGAGCELYYFPKKNVFVFTGINLGTVTDSPIHAQAEEAREALYEAILN